MAWLACVAREGQGGDCVRYVGSEYAMEAIRVVRVLRIERDNGGQEVCDLREARRCGCDEFCISSGSSSGC